MALIPLKPFSVLHDLNQPPFSSYCYHLSMDIITMILGGALFLLLGVFILRLSYTVMKNLINGRKFHQSLLEEFDKLRLSKMLTALGINKTAYIYQTNVNDINKQMKSCSDCGNTNECDDKLTQQNLSDSEIAFCNNEAELKEMLSEKKAG